MACFDLFSGCWLDKDNRKSNVCYGQRCRPHGALFSTCKGTGSLHLVYNRNTVNFIKIGGGTSPFMNCRVSSHPRWYYSGFYIMSLVCWFIQESWGVNLVQTSIMGSWIQPRAWSLSIQFIAGNSNCCHHQSKINLDECFMSLSQSSTTNPWNVWPTHNMWFLAPENIHRRGILCCVCFEDCTS